MKVYELIQELAKFPAEADVWVQMYGTEKQIEVYVEEWQRMGQDRTRFDGHVEEVDWKFYGEVVELDCEIDDL